MKFFNDVDEAKRYAQSRPYFHPLAIARAKASAVIKEDLPIALDIACGTGQSSNALNLIAEQVIGIDISWNMLTNAEGKGRILYIQSKAESLPFADDSFPLISIALAFHWFDRKQILAETSRVLTAGGALLIHNNGFTGKMREDPDFEEWAHRVYQSRFPTPPSDYSPLAQSEATEVGFRIIDEESYENEVSFTIEELVAYLMTQTNVMAALASGRESLESTRRWLMAQISPYFINEYGTFVFTTRAWILRTQDR